MKDAVKAKLRAIGLGVGEAPCAAVTRGGMRICRRQSPRTQPFRQQVRLGVGAEQQLGGRVELVKRPRP